MSFGLLVAVQK